MFVPSLLKHLVAFTEPDPIRFEGAKGVRLERDEQGVPHAIATNGRVLVEAAWFENVPDQGLPPVRNGFAVVVPKGTLHNIINTSSTEPMKLYTIYTPPNHKDGTIHKTKTEADAAEEHFDGATAA